MAKKNRKKLFSRQQLFILLTCTIVISSIGVCLHHYAKNIVTKFIKETIIKSTNRLYFIDFKDIQINLFTGSIGLSEVNFKINSIIYNQMAAQQILPEYVCDAQVTQLNLEHVQLLNAYFNHSITAQSISVEQPTLKLIHLDTSLSACALPDDRTAYQRISAHWKSIRVDEIELQQIKIRYINQRSPNCSLTAIANLQINVTDLLIDSLSQYDKNRLYYTQDITASLKHYHFETNDKRYTIQINEIAGSTSKHEARILGLQITPRYPEMEFSTQFKEQKARYNISAEEIVLSKINYHLLKSQGNLLASTLDIRGADIAIFLNREMSFTQIDRSQNFPSLALKRLPINIQLDTVKWNDSKISYSEYNPKSQRKGTVFFDQLNGKINHVTNNITALQHDRFCNATTTGLLMGIGRMNTTFRFDLLDPKGAFVFSGGVGKMNARILNPALRPLALIKISKGFIDSIHFEGNGNTDQCKGKLIARYSQLRIGFLEKDTISPKLKWKALASMYTNILIIRSENPSNDDGLLQTSSFLYRRPMHASFFNTIWKGISMGLMDNIGLGPTTLQQMQDLAIHMQRVKKEHQIRRENRIKRRLERKAQTILKQNEASTY
ncbi:MAG: hypothetical protein E6Q66_05480 [Pedobacter sp.]|nr:MAG: hypothetical protein E6Q66_05480 [Pedobacter sp.]